MASEPITVESQLEYLVSVAQKLETFVETLAPLKSMLEAVGGTMAMGGPSALPLNPLSLLGSLPNGNDHR